jgi:Co/Zn/Cd efflux system component
MEDSIKSLPDILTKQCALCNIEKNINDFYLLRKTDIKRQAICKECDNIQKVKKYHETHIKKPKGLDKLVELKIITQAQKEEIIKLLHDPMVKVSLIAKKYNINYNLLHSCKKKI